MEERAGSFHGQNNHTNKQNVLQIEKSRHSFPIMKSFSKTILSLYILVASLFISPSTADGQLRGAYDYLKEKYDDLPDNGKFATGAVAGFGVSRLAIKSATGVVKIAGAAFVA